MSGLVADLAVEARGVAAELAVGAGRTLVLLGPNGSGKSTLLEAIAGIVPAAGALTLDGASLTGVGARDRRIGLLSQDDALFPTMSVRDNVAFGPRARGASRADAKAAAEDWLARVGLAGLGDRRPGELSGGQARRVAIARALAAEPRVLLLDEPFAGLDVASASATRALVATLLADRTAAVTTHDALDAHALADDVAVMEAGRVVEHGPAAAVLARPRTPFAARMAARVLVTGTMHGGALVTGSGVRIPVTGGPGAGAAAGIAVHPAAIAVARDGEPRDPARVWMDDAVVAVEPRGDEVRVHGRDAAADVDAAVAAVLGVGDVVGFGVEPGAPAYALTSGR